MDINIEQGISLEIEGEIGKFQTLPISNLMDIAKSLQDLVMLVARYDITTKDLVHYENFNIEITDFIKSSAVPVFALTKRISLTYYDVNEQRRELSEKLDNIFQITKTGEFSKIIEMYPDVQERNDIVNSLHSFTNSFGNSPVRLGSYKGIGQFENKYKIKKLTDKIKKNLIVDIAEADILEKSTKESAVATIQLTKKGNKTTRRIEKVYTKDERTLSVTFNSVLFNDVEYLLNYDLLCSYEIEEDVHIINYNPFDLVGTGDSENDARESFKEEFDYLYDWLNSLEDSALSSRLLAIKRMLNLTVKEKVIK